MKKILALLITGGVVLSAPAAAQDLKHLTPENAAPRTLAAIDLANRRVEMLAVTRRARADTPLRREHLYDSQNMAKMMPGYPQPAFITFDIRFKF